MIKTKGKNTGAKKHGPPATVQTAPSPVVTKLIDTYTYQSDNAIFPAARFDATRSFLNNVTNNLAHVTSHVTVHHVIEQLLRTALMNEEARVMLQDYLVSDEVGFFIRHLIQVNRDITGILTGMEAGIRHTITRFPGKLHFGVSLLLTWFNKTNFSLLVPQPGQTVLVLTFLRNCCFEFNNRRTEPSEEMCKFLDVRVQYIFKHLLSAETGTSINQMDKQENTALHLAGGLFRMTRLTTCLLATNGINVNAVNREKKTPFVTALNCMYLSSTGQDVLLTLLEQHALVISQPDSRGHTSLDYAIHLLLTAPSGQRCVLDIICKVAKHRTSTTPMINNNLKKLLTWRPIFGTAESFLNAVNSFVDSDQFNPQLESQRNQRNFITDLYRGVSWSQLPPEVQLKLVTIVSMHKKATDHDIAAGFVQLLSLELNFRSGYFETFAQSFSSHRAYRILMLFEYNVMEAFCKLLQDDKITPELAMTVYRCIFEVDHAQVPSRRILRCFLALIHITPTGGASMQAYFHVATAFLNDRRLQFSNMDSVQIKAIQREIFIKLTAQHQGYEAALALSRLLIQHQNMTQDFIDNGILSLLTLAPTFVNKEYYLRTLKLFVESRLFNIESIRLYGDLGMLDYVLGRLRSPQPWPEFSLAIVTILAEQHILSKDMARRVFSSLTVLSRNERRLRPELALATIAVSSTFTIEITDLLDRFEDSMGMYRYYFTGINNLYRPSSSLVRERYIHSNGRAPLIS